MCQRHANPATAFLFSPTGTEEKGCCNRKVFGAHFKKRPAGGLLNSNESFFLWLTQKINAPISKNAAVI